MRYAFGFLFFEVFPTADYVSIALTTIFERCAPSGYIWHETLYENPIHYIKARIANMS